MLTKHQQIVLGELLAILQTNNIVLLKGSAGVGKTYLVNMLVKQLSGKILVTAPTHKALQVLHQKIDYSNNSVILDFTTTQSALKLQKKINYTTGEISFVPNFNEKFPPLKNYRYLIIDECSMINEDLKSHIEKHSNLQKCKVIFIGDEKQINPVNEEDSIIFNSDYPEVELKEIVRQKEGNSIIDLSRNINKLWKYENDLSPKGEGYLFTDSLAKIIENLAIENGTDNLKYLAWTNKDVDRINFLVRKHIYENPAKLEKGESIVLNDNYSDFLKNNEELKIKDLEVLEKSFNYYTENGIESIKFKVYSINPLRLQESEYSEASVKHRIFCIHEDDEKRYKKFIFDLKEKAKLAVINWKQYYEFLENFIDFKYNHAISVHKSQGSTFKKVIINVKNICLNRNEKEKNRLLYTAITRASDLIIIYNF